ncbi:putative membrane protein [Thioalkalivibrio nitratireducens DSM 14787]|uniref:Membrane protein n=1 Tax=Thioalkalivibrio nitratireducens (strain DSM 14787 / UNIQEM 213 / ALEN2) TaxID=1255043 RepID=L0E227_THIND|nr:DUF2306 domain-containing protein [Thioalkalivibrio nitratireducens]AGA35302.1 putative membrane protein [Thioalkalivibrio nitratireducens DSM 14787]
MIATLASLLALFSLHYLRPGMPDGFIEQLPLYREHAFWFLLHVVGAAVALAVGPWQFLSSIRARRPWIHRATGTLYAAGVLAGGIGGLFLSGLAYGGIGVQLGFMILGGLWLAATAIGVTAIGMGRVAVHRAWMLRSFALTFAAVTLRVWLVLLEPFLGFETAYQVAAWLGWLPNLLVVEWWLRRGSTHAGPIEPSRNRMARNAIDRHV